MVEKKEDIHCLEEKAKWLRKKTIEMIWNAKSGHPGGSLSEIEIIVALYYKIMRIDPVNPKWEDRDRFVLSKGHCCPPLYAVLANRGFFDETELNCLRKYGSFLHGHPSILTPGIDSVSGSLGNGLSVAAGMAMAARKNKKNYKVFVLIGDGEMQEGANWEAAMCIAHNNFSNIIAIVDYNKLQINGLVKDNIAIEPLSDKWRAFGWITLEIDGHDIRQVVKAFKKAILAKKPTVIIANTVKGKGVSFMENRAVWHGKTISDEEYEQAIDEIERG